jgi:ankyrin repeat protein
MNLHPPPLPPPPQDDDPIITLLKPVYGSQGGLNDDNIKRIDPNNGQTILHHYCRYINTTPLEVYRYLIETKGCDVNAQDNNKDTPLHRAFHLFDPNDGGDIKVLHYLLSNKSINGNIKGEYGYTSLHLACDNINYLPLDIFKVLIETLGCDVNAQDEYNNTPLHLAFHDFDPEEGGDMRVLTYLLTQKDVNIHIKNNYGHTLLHIACQRINDLPLDVFKLLIETMGCDVNVQDENKYVPLHLALRLFNPHQGDVTILTYLFSHKSINFNTNDEKGRNSLHLACTNNLSESRDSAELNVECDTVLCQIVEFIAERCVQQVLDEITP